jgi:hypothetical protein
VFLRRTSRQELHVTNCDRTSRGYERLSSWWSLSRIKRKSEPALGTASFLEQRCATDSPIGNIPAVGATSARAMRSVVVQNPGPCSDDFFQTILSSALRCFKTIRPERARLFKAFHPQLTARRTSSPRTDSLAREA